VVDDDEALPTRAPTKNGVRARMHPEKPARPRTHVRGVGEGRAEGRAHGEATQAERGQHEGVRIRKRRRGRYLPHTPGVVVVVVVVAS
jgi:hypothetical protein